MHVAITLFTIFATWRWGDLKHWRQYHPTMLFITVGGLLYEYLVHDYTLWVFHPDFLYNHKLTVIIYAVITMPLSVFIFLSHYPQTLRRQILYLAKWVIIYISAEFILLYFGRISYQHGWNLFHSLLFDIMMFPMLRLHHTKPLWAYQISVVIIVILMLLFKVPFSK